MALPDSIRALVVNKQENKEHRITKRRIRWRFLFGIVHCIRVEMSFDENTMATFYIAKFENIKLSHCSFKFKGGARTVIKSESTASYKISVTLH